MRLIAICAVLLLCWAGAAMGVEAIAESTKPAPVIDKDGLIEKFGIDRPWDDMAHAPALIQRHRGMVAAALRLREPNSPLDGDVLASTLAVTAEMIAALDAGKDYLADQRDEFWSAYFSQFDGSGQLFAVYLPSEYDSARQWPLLVFLHGLGSRPRPYWWDWPDLGKRPYLEVAPWGRGDMSYGGLGEDDVLQVIEYMKRWYNIDPAQVYLTGNSMGGRGTWKVAADHPDLFAAAGPFAGWATGLPLENLRNLPLNNRHGQDDRIVPIDTSRYAASQLAQLGYSIVHREFPNQGHNDYMDGDARHRNWILGMRRPAKPPAITYTCQTPENGRAYWLTVRQFTDPHLRARVKAHAGGSKNCQTLTLLMENIDVLELDVANMPLDPNLGVTVQIGFYTFDVPGPLSNQLFLVRDTQNNWSAAGDWSPPASTVRAYRPGAAANLYGREPLLIVYGTANGPERTALLKGAAEKLALKTGTEGEKNLGVLPVKADKQVSDQDIKHFNLLLLGSAKDNHVVANMADKLPFTINEKNELLAGDREPVSFDGAALQLLYYNPLSPQRLIFLYALDDKLASADPQLQRGWQYIPMTGRGGFNRGDQPDLMVTAIGGRIRRQMQFTHDWRWRKVPGADRQLPKAMANSHAFTQAALRITQRKTGAHFALSRVHYHRFDPCFITLADVAIEGSPREIMLATMSGQELLDIRQNYHLPVFPAYDPNDIDPQRDYDIVLPPNLSGMLAQRKKTLRNVRAAADWDVGQLWREVFGDTRRERTGRGSD